MFGVNTYNIGYANGILSKVNYPLDYVVKRFDLLRDGQHILSLCELIGPAMLIKMVSLSTHYLHSYNDLSDHERSNSAMLVQQTQKINRKNIPGAYTPITGILLASNILLA